MADLEPGIRLVNAAHFHAARPWVDRVRINSGVTIDQGRVLPRDDWRMPSPDELAMLTECACDPAETLALFNLPARLLARWWDVAAQESSAFEEFGREVMEFLHFKQLPLPPRCKVAAVAHAAGLASTKPDVGGLTANPARAGMLAGINLSDEEAALVYLNFGAARAAAQTPPSEYPVVRVALQPGEGFWLPRIPIATDGDTRGRTEVDIQLVLGAE
jgi:hypothetical protein